MVKLLLDGSVWYVLAIVVAALLTASQRADAPRALSRFYGCVIGVMGTGHLTAIAFLHKERWVLYALGGVIAIPGWLLAMMARRATPRQLVWLNALPGLVMIILLTSAPLAVPALLNILYLRKPRKALLIGALGTYAA